MIVHQVSDLLMGSILSIEKTGLHAFVYENCGAV